MLAKRNAEFFKVNAISNWQFHSAQSTIAPEHAEILQHELMIGSLVSCRQNISYESVIF